MIIGSFTPRIDYSQGNKWWTRLQTMNDFHKPNLDGIAFQELITDEMAAFDTEVNADGTIVWKSAGKQVAWQEYMTNIDQSFGSFSAFRELAHMANGVVFGAARIASRISSMFDSSNSDKPIVSLSTSYALSSG